MSNKNIVKLLEQISVPLTSSRDCDNAFVVAYDIYSDGYHHYYSEVTRYLLQNKNIKLDNIEKFRQDLTVILDNINMLKNNLMILKLILSQSSLITKNLIKMFLPLCMLKMKVMIGR